MTSILLLQLMRKTYSISGSIKALFNIRKCFYPQSSVLDLYEEDDVALNPLLLRRSNF